MAGTWTRVPRTRRAPGGWRPGRLREVIVWFIDVRRPALPVTSW